MSLCCFCISSGSMSLWTSSFDMKDARSKDRKSRCFHLLRTFYDITNNHIIDIFSKWCWDISSKTRPVFLIIVFFLQFSHLIQLYLERCWQPYLVLFPSAALSINHILCHNCLILWWGWAFRYCADRPFIQIWVFSKLYFKEILSPFMTYSRSPSLNYPSPKYLCCVF